MKGMMGAIIMIGTTLALAPGGAWSQEVHGKAAGAIGGGVGVIIIGGGGGGDTTAPAIPDITLAFDSATSITVTWYSVGDDNMTGTVATHELRYRVGQVFPQILWDDAGSTVVSGMPAPAIANTLQTVTVTGLAAGETYSFMLKVSDEKPNSAYSASDYFCLEITAPDAVRGVVAVPSGPNTVDLVWASGHDDGSTGTAASYTIYYTTEPFAASEGALLVSDADTITLNAGPSPATQVVALDDGVTYYMAVVAWDEKPNAGPPSTVVAVATPAYVDSGDPGPVSAGCGGSTANGAGALLIVGLAAAAAALRK